MFADGVELEERSACDQVAVVGNPSEESDASFDGMSPAAVPAWRTFGGQVDELAVSPVRADGYDDVPPGAGRQCIR